jgi:hypothetical protein
MSMRRIQRSHPAVAMLVVASLIHPPALAAADQTPAAQAPAAKAPATAAKPASAATTTPVPVDGGWPRRYSLSNGGNMLVYQPQLSTWDGQRHMVAFSAVSYAASSTAKPALGTIKIEADTSVATTERLVSFKSLKISQATFPTLEKEQIRELVATIDKTIPEEDRVIALDRVLAHVNASSIVPKNVDGVKADPPAIFFSKTPAIIVNLDGPAIWSPIKDNDLKYAVNTNWDLFEHGPSKTYYLRHERIWLKSAEPTKGQWTAAGKLPESFSKLPADANWNEVRASLPGATVKAGALPRVFVSETPAELILLTGEPSYLEVSGSGLLWVNNTESDVFRLGKTGSVYYLVAGRWFSAPDFTGPWTFATLSLPGQFKKISLEHPRSRVLASVPGTDQAAEAVLLAQMPQTARVNRKELKGPDVAYQGDPQFAAIESTTIQRAVNTDKDIFKVGNDYYMCYQGVWFLGKTAQGPWEVAQFVPQEIYKIPASSPAHHVTYVTVEDDDDDDDEWVTYAALGAYTGVMVAWGCAVWGSGYYYPPYYGGGFYPYYYPHFSTYGYSAWYNPWTGAYGRSAAVYGPYGGAGVGARYNPRTGTYSRGAAAYGPGGSRGVAQAYNPRTGTYAQTRQGSNVYGSWGSTSVQRGDDWATTNRYTDRRTGTTTRTIRTDEGAAVTKRGPGGNTAVGVGDGGNVYAGHDGNVYRRENGTWQKHENGGWQNTDRQPTGDRPTPSQQSAGSTSGARAADRGTVDQLNRDSAARAEGSTRTSSYGTYKGGSGTANTGSYRSGGASRSGGGMRGGGGRRR